MIIAQCLTLSMVELTVYLIVAKRVSLLFGVLYRAYLIHEKGLSLCLMFKCINEYVIAQKKFRLIIISTVT